jgi:hypothetical protein
VASRSNLWIVIAAFTLGLIGGVLVDRAVGGPGGLAVGLLVLLVPGTFVLVGPMAQTYWEHRFVTEASNRERFHDHAKLLVDCVFRFLPWASLSYDVNNWPDQGQGRYSIIIQGGGSLYGSFQDLSHWSSARQHLLADPTMKPLLEDLERRLSAGLAQKRDLDELYKNEIEATLRAELGLELVAATPSTGWAEYPLPALWYPTIIIPRLRESRAATLVKMEPTAFTHATGEPATPVQRLTLDGFPVIQVREPTTIDETRFRTAYDSLRANPKLRSAVERARLTREEDSGHIRDFAIAARGYGEAVEVSEKHLLGVCPGCSHLVPR